MSARNLDDKTFKPETAQGYAFIDYYADWCQPCKTMAPIIDQMADELAPKAIKVFKVNVDEATNTAKEARIRGLPTFALMKDGAILATRPGQASKSALLDWIEANRN